MKYLVRYDFLDDEDCEKVEASRHLFASEKYAERTFDSEDEYPVTVVVKEVKSGSVNRFKVYVDYDPTFSAEELIDE